MSVKVSKIIPAVLFMTMLYTVILMYCVSLKGNINDTDRDSQNSELSDNSFFETRKKAGGDHVFHEGEMRGVWVPYFELAYGKEGFERHFDDIVSRAKAHELNTLFVHVRSHCDAAYPSELFPRAEIYSDLDDDYDPLIYMVQTAHDAGLEIHAWINPFRADEKTAAILSEKLSDRCFISCDGEVYLNPAKSEVRQLIIDGTREIVSRYNVDGVHLDDYFYMFDDEEYDSPEYKAYYEDVGADKAMTLNQWRCENINMLVSGLYAVVKATDSRMLFGISPQGNIDNDLQMGADVYSWCSRYGYVDYIAPQLYFNSENPQLPFEKALAQWKSLIKDDRIKLYTGLALYKQGSDLDGGTWKNRDDIIPYQIDYVRDNNIDGYILYSWGYLG